MDDRFIESSYYKSLHNDIAHSYRQIGHSLDNYGVDMPPELKEALEGLYEAHRAVLDVMDGNRVYKVISHTIERMLENDSKAFYEADSYTLSDGRRVVWDYRSKSFIDNLGKVYTPISENENIIGFELIE